MRVELVPCGRVTGGYRVCYTCITLIGVKAFSSNDAWAVGYYRDLTYQRWRTLIKHYTKLP